MQVEIQPYKTQTAVSTVRKHSTEQNVSLHVSKQTGCELQVVQAVELAFMQDNIRAAAKFDMPGTVLGLTLALEACAKVYCGGSKTDNEVYEEAVTFTMQQFGHLNVAEIRQAFALGAAGSLDLGTEDMTTFYGLFTIGMLGKILKAYDQYRKRIVAELQRAESAAAAMEAQKRKAWDEEAWGQSRLAKFQSLENPAYTDFSETDYNYFLKTGDLVHTQEEKRKAWEDARLFAIQEFEADAHTGLTTRKNPQLSILLKNAAQAGRDGVENEKFTIRRTAIAKSLLVMRWAETRK